MTRPTASARAAGDVTALTAADRAFHATVVEAALTEHAGQPAALDGDDPQAWLDAVGAHLDNAATVPRTLR